MLECEDGNLHLKLSAKIGHPDHAHFPDPPCSPPNPSSKKKSPSQLRRAERRREEAISRADKSLVVEEASSVTSEKDTIKGIPSPEDAVTNPSEDHANNLVMKPAEEVGSFKCEQCDYKASCKAIFKKHAILEHTKVVTQERCNMCSANLDNQNMLTNHMINKHDHPGELLVCDLWDFITSRKTGLDIHVAKKHKGIQQVDGNSSDSEESYAGSYWESDYMGTDYQTYLDAIGDIESANISIDEKPIERERALKARESAFLKRGDKLDFIHKRMPPWSSKSQIL